MHGGAVKVLVWSDGTLEGGAGRQAAVVAIGLADRGHEVTLAHCTGHDVALPSTVAQRTLAVDDLWGSQPGESPSQAEVSRVLESVPADVVLVNDTCPVANLRLKQQLVDRQQPWAAVEHLGDIPPAFNCESIHQRSGWLLAQAAAVVAVSAALRAELQARHRELPVTVIGNGRPDEYFEAVDARQREATRGALGVDDDSFLVLVVARVEEPKGSLVIARALEMMSSTPGWPHLRIMWAGDGTQRSRLTALARLRRWEPQLTMLGQQPNVRPLLQAADLLLHPTYSEGMPLAVIEAMAAGLPVIGSDIAAMREVMGGTGVLVPDPHLDRHATAAAVSEVLTDLMQRPEQRERLGQQGRAYARDHFRASTMMDRYERVLCDVIS